MVRKYALILTTLFRVIFNWLPYTTLSQITWKYNGVKMKNLKIKNLNKKDIQNLKEIKIIELEEMKIQDLKVLKVKIEIAIKNIEKE